jgi:HK97 family phage major capsid protein
MKDRLGLYRAPDGAEGGAPAAVADPVDGTRALEGLTVQVKSLADSVEGYEKRMKETFGKDLKAVQEEADAKRTALEKHFDEEVRKLAQPGAQPAGGPKKDDYHGFSEGVRGFGEFLAAAFDVRTAPQSVDPRLIKMHEATARSLNMATGTQGGFLVGPQAWTAEILSIQYPLTLLQSRCRQIPAGDQPDAELPFPILDQTGTKGLYSGVTVYPMSEGGATTVNTGITFQQGVLKPNEFGAILPPITEKLLRNAPAMGTFGMTLMRDAITAYIENKIVSGNGVTTLLGWLGCSAQYLVSRDTTNEINFIDCVNMLTRILPRGNYVWVAHPLCKPQLMTMTDGVGHLVWQPDAQVGAPEVLLGLPLIYSEFASVLGSTGDLSLVDLNYYLLRNGAPVKITDDMGLSGTNFSTNMRSIKAVFSVDGQPWLRGTLKLQDGTTEVSPFVILKTK